jgi:endonuclease/exonuclease/phosphatase (EEP) superfamily protein YafD
MTQRMPRFVAVMALALSTAGCSRNEFTARAPDPGRVAVKVMTYNVNFGISGDPDAVELVRKEAPELLFLQETNPGWETAFGSALGDDYPEMRFRHAPAAGGMGVLSKWPIVEDEPIPPPERGWFGAWRLVFDGPAGKLQALDVHLHPQLSESGSVTGVLTTQTIRRAEIDEYLDHLDPALPTLIAGDFNEGRRGAALALLRGRGYESALYEAHGSQATWHWPTSVGTLSAQFDHVAHRTELELLDARVVPGGRSDHQPVVAVFQLPARPTR